MLYPKVSIITPTFNQSSFIQETIESVLQQDYPAIEHIVVDDGSTDQTRGILSRYPHLKWFSQSNAGQTNAINNGFKASSGEILSWLNSDDLLLPGAVSAVVKAFKEAERKEFVYGGVLLIDEEGRKLFAKKAISYDKNILIYGRGLTNQPASFFRRDLLKRIGYLDESLYLCMDLDFWVRAAKENTAFKNIPKLLAATRLHKKTKTYLRQKSISREHKYILNKYGLLYFKDAVFLNELFFLLLYHFYRAKNIFQRCIQARQFQLFPYKRAFLKIAREKKVLIFQDIAWRHYKTAVFNALYPLAKAKGIQIEVIYLALVDNKYAVLKNPDLAVKKYPYRIIFNKKLQKVFWLKRAFSLLKITCQVKPALIILYGWRNLANVPVLFLAKLLKIKVIACIDSTELDKPRLLFKEIYKIIFLKLCHLVFCPGQAAKNYLKKLKVKPEKITITKLTADVLNLENLYHAAFAKREELKSKQGFKTKNFLYVGRLSPEKNVKTLLEAFYNTQNRSAKSKEWGLIIVGAGPEAISLRRLAEKFNSKNIFFTGPKTHYEVISYYALSDVLVLPSISEPWGLVVNEAFACRLPVIASDRCGSARDLIKPDKTGFLFNPEQAEELVGLMLKFINQEVNTVAMGEQAGEIIKNYNPKVAAQEMLEAIKTILA